MYSPKKEPKKVIDEEATKRKQEAADKKAQEANEEPKPVGASYMSLGRDPGPWAGVGQAMRCCGPGVGLLGYQRGSGREAARGAGRRCGPGRVWLEDVVPVGDGGSVRRQARVPKYWGAAAGGDLQYPWDLASRGEGAEWSRAGYHMHREVGCLCPWRVVAQSLLRGAVPRHVAFRLSR